MIQEMVTLGWRVCVCLYVCVCGCVCTHMCLIRSTKLSTIHQQHSPPLFLLFSPKAPCYTECIQSNFRDAAVYQGTRKHKL